MIRTLRDHSSLLSAELRWLVRLRWGAAALIMIGATVHAMWASQWSDAHTRTMALAFATLGYNAFFRWIGRRHDDDAAEAPMPLGYTLCAAAQILFDLAALTLLALWTGGVSSPLLGLFVLHMVLGSLLLPPVISYGVAIVAVCLMLGGLWMSGQLPHEPSAILVGSGWTATLLLTVFLTGHITSLLKRREEQRRMQQGRLQAILDTAVDAIITIDEVGTIQSVNPATSRLFGYASEDLVGRNISILMPEPDRSQHDRYIADYRRTGEAKIIGIGRDVLGCRSDGTVFPIELAVSEVPMNGRLLYTGILRDITERRRRESELKSLNESLIRHHQALIQAEKMAATGTMAAGIAHEIANPLSGIDSVLQLARRRGGGLPPESVDLLQEQVGRIERIARELTGFAHPHADRAEEWRTMPVNEIVSDALHMLRFEHRLRSVRVECDCNSDAGCARVQPQAVQQVLINIILNALDAMERSPLPVLRLRSSSADGWSAIEISDNGHGIEPDLVERIFDPFFTTKPPGRGTGLGLSISSMIIQRQGGRCEVQSTSEGQDTGTTFRIFLPGLSDADHAPPEGGNPGDG